MAVTFKLVYSNGHKSDYGLLNLVVFRYFRFKNVEYHHIHCYHLSTLYFVFFSALVYNDFIENTLFHCYDVTAYTFAHVVCIYYSHYYSGQLVDLTCL